MSKYKYRRGDDWPLVWLVFLMSPFILILGLIILVPLLNGYLFLVKILLNPLTWIVLVVAFIIFRLYDKYQHRKRVENRRIKRLEKQNKPSTD